MCDQVLAKEKPQREETTEEEKRERELFLFVELLGLVGGDGFAEVGGDGAHSLAKDLDDALSKIGLHFH